MADHKLYKHIKKTARRTLSALGLSAALAGSITVLSYEKKPSLEICNKQEGELGSVITVGTFNISGGRGRNFVFPVDLLPPRPWLFNEVSDHGLLALNELIIREEVDLACFQEIEKNQARGEKAVEDQPKQFAENTLLRNYVFDSNVTADFLQSFKINNGNAIMSQVPLHSSRREELGPYRSFGFSDLADLITGTKGILHSQIKYQHHDLNILCTHLSNLELTLFGEEREQELESLFTYALKTIKSTAAPVLLLGDLNTEPEDKAWNLARKILDPENMELYCGLELLNDPKSQKLRTATFLGEVTLKELGQKNTRDNNMGQLIDYICTVQERNSPLNLKIVDLKPLHDQNYSDHAPLIAKIELSYE